MAETCTECKQPLVEVDKRGKHIRRLRDVKTARLDLNEPRSPVEDG